jgi:hypothetical protein
MLKMAEFYHAGTCVVTEPWMGVASIRATKIPAKFRPEHEAEITDALHDHESCRVSIAGTGEFSARDGSLARARSISTWGLMVFSSLARVT